MLGRAALGIDGYEVFHTISSGYSLSFSAGELKSKELAEESGYGIRVLKKGRLGFSYCDSGKDLDKAARHATALSAFSTKTRFSFSPEKKYSKPKTQDTRPKTQDPRVASLGSRELKALLSQVRDGVEHYSKKARVILSSGWEDVVLSNSEGFKGGYRSTGISAYAEAMKDDGFGFAYEEGISMPKDFTSIGERAGSMAKAMKGARKLKPGKYTAIFELSALDELLSVLLPSFSGDWKRKKTSLLADKAGKKVFNKSLSIYDDALSEGSDAKPFDDEGTPSRRIPLVEKGVVKNFVFDRETAALGKTSGSGFCARAHYSAPPGAGTSNITISAGGYSDLEQELENPLVIHSLHGSHTANTTTGDFGLEVNVAFHKARSGKEPSPVRGFLISGNIFKLLNGNIYIEKKSRVLGSIIAPRLAFVGVQVIS